MKTKTTTTSILFAAGIAGSLLAAACQSQSDDHVVTKAAIGANEVELVDVPTDVHRRAAQLLEDVRGTESAPSWESADFAPVARILSRPDVQGPAYYEIRVTVDGEPMGHIVASAGDHDFPITHWNYEGLSPTESLDQKADGEIAAYDKVDTLTYVAVDSRGGMLANIGSLPPRIVGQDSSGLEDPPEDTTETWVPDASGGNDEEAGTTGGELVIEGPAEPEPMELTTWESYEQLRNEYRESYGAMIESLRLQAAEEWDTEAAVAESGEGLVQDQPFELALLYAGADVELSGEGAELVQAERVESAPGREVLILTAFDSRAGEELPVNVSLTYPNGQHETLLFVVLSPKNVGSALTSGENVHFADLGQMKAWSPWSYFWAGSHNDQRLYDQMESGEGPNTSGCYSGCGATAWAMLFGWGDYQAGSGNPSWSHRWGLYRHNGGYGSNAVAPKYQDAGVRNMTWEIRNRIGTFCAFGSGATFPWEMSDASGYLAGRTGASLTTNYNVLGIHTSGLRKKARDAIIHNDTPAIIGTGWLNHYPLAYGYRWRKRTVRKCILWHCWNDTEYQRQFYVNQGWGGTNNGWVNAGTWFAGRLFAN